MTSTLVDVLLAVSASPAVMVLAKATVLMVVVLAALRLTPAVRASRRALMLACLFAAIAALPVAAIGPALRVAVRQAAPPPIQRNAVLPAPVSYTDAVADSCRGRPGL